MGNLSSHYHDGTGVFLSCKGQASHDFSGPLRSPQEEKARQEVARIVIQKRPISCCDLLSNSTSSDLNPVPSSHKRRVLIAVGRLGVGKSHVLTVFGYELMLSGHSI